MTTRAASTLRSRAHTAPRLFRSVERLRGALLWLTGFAGAFVFMEPSPYEVASLLTIIVFALTGLSLRPALMPLIVLLLLYNIGFSLAVIQVIDQPKLVIWVPVSWYLSATAIFFAAMLGTNTAERLSLLMRGTVAAAAVVVASSPSSPISACSARSPTCSCSTTARTRPSTIRTCSARSWSCRRCSRCSAS